MSATKLMTKVVVLLVDGLVPLDCVGVDGLILDGLGVHLEMEVLLGDGRRDPSNDPDLTEAAAGDVAFSEELETLALCLADILMAIDGSGGGGGIEGGMFSSLRSMAAVVAVVVEEVGFHLQGLFDGAIAGICIAAVVLTIVLVGLYLRCRRSKEMKEGSIKLGVDTPVQGVSGKYMGNSVEFSYAELANATDDLNIIYKIGTGGFGDVYLGELKGEKAAINKIDMQASKEFLAELKVRLLGYCVEGSLCVFYEYIENGNLSQHLPSLEKDPLPWSSRVQISLDSAKGLEYIHEHTKPVYIHRDIKLANILVNKSFQAKVLM
ncbi:Chitin elicitor receptor kinase 1 [Bienertia sinuspersici]